MAMGMAAMLSLPLLNTNLSSRCNSLAGTATVSKTANLSAMASADDLQISYQVSDCESLWIFRVVEAAQAVTHALVVGIDVIIDVYGRVKGYVQVDKISALVSTHQQTAVLLQELD